MELKINGNVIDPACVTCNDGLGYGRFDSTNIRIHAYSMSLPRAEIVAAFSARYQGTCDEIRCDDAKSGDDSPFKQMNYAPLSEAFEFPNALAHAIRIWFDRDIMLSFLPRTADFQYVINSTEKILVTSDGVTLEGRCFEYLVDPR